MLRNENIPTLPETILSFNPCSLVQQFVVGYRDVDLQSNYLEVKSLEQRGFGLKHEFELKFLFSIFSKLNQTKINEVSVMLQAYVTLQILCNP